MLLTGLSNSIYYTITFQVTNRISYSANFGPRKSVDEFEFWLFVFLQQLQYNMIIWVRIKSQD